ncbi:hypothetical protein [Mesorhizobium sp. A556]
MVAPEVIAEAATWLAASPRTDRPVVPLLAEKFGLSAKESCQTIRQANLIRSRET